MAFQFSDASQFPYTSEALFLGLDDRGREIGIETEVHAITIGGAGAGKGTSLLVPNARRWPHNLLCIDPKGENAVLSWKHREEMGQKVGILDPFEEIEDDDIPDRLRVSINPLEAIDPASKRARAGLIAIGNGLVVVHDPKHMEWVDGARTLLSGLAAYVVAEAPSELRTLATVRKTLMQPDSVLFEDAQEMARDDRLGGLIRAAGITIITAIESDRGMEKDFLGLARRATQWLDDEAISESLSASTFSLSDLKTGSASLFLVLPADYLDGYAAFLRLFVKSALHAMGAKAKDGRECLFLLDEFFSLGRLDELSEAAGRMRSYGVHLWPFLQSLSQLHQLYGREGAQTFLANADAQIFLGNDKDDYTLEYISRRIGRTTIDDIGPPPDAPVQPSGVGAQIVGSSFGLSKTRLAKDFRYTGGAMALIGGAMGAASNMRHNRASARYRDQMTAYERERSRAGQLALEPQQIAKLVQKDRDDVADNLIVLTRGNRALLIKPAPYFRYDPNSAQDRFPAPPSEAFSGQKRSGQQLLAEYVIMFAMLFYVLGAEASPASIFVVGPVITVFRLFSFERYKNGNYFLSTNLIFFGAAVASFYVAVLYIDAYGMFGTARIIAMWVMWIVYAILFATEDWVRSKFLSGVGKW